jgi:hypothetical protein
MELMFASLFYLVGSFSCWKIDAFRSGYADSLVFFSNWLAAPPGHSTTVLAYTPMITEAFQGHYAFLNKFLFIGFQVFTKSL